jgi:hypothetical protein
LNTLPSKYNTRSKQSGSFTGSHEQDELGRVSAKLRLQAAGGAAGSWAASIVGQIHTKGGWMSDRRRPWSSRYVTFHQTSQFLGCSRWWADGFDTCMRNWPIKTLYSLLISGSVRSHRRKTYDNGPQKRPIDPSHQEHVHPCHFPRYVLKCRYGSETALSEPLSPSSFHNIFAPISDRHDDCSVRQLSTSASFGSWNQASRAIE